MLFLYYIKQIDSMLPCACSDIDHRWRQNVVRRNKWHTKQWPSVSLMFLPHFDVLCDLLLDTCTATWKLFVLYNKELNFVSIYKSCPFWQTRIKSFDVIYDLYKMEQFHWLLCVGKELWLVKANHGHCQTWLECCFSWIETFQRSKNWTAKSTNLKENAG